MGEARRRASRGYRPGNPKTSSGSSERVVSWLPLTKQQTKPVHGDHHAGSLGRHRRTGGVLGGGALYRSSGRWWTLDWTRLRQLAPCSRPHTNENKRKHLRFMGLSACPMFPRLAQHYRSVVNDLVMSLQALASSLKKRGFQPPATPATTAVMAGFFRGRPWGPAPRPIPGV